MASFLLIPRRLAWRLVLRAAGAVARGAGHVVSAPTLPGIGGTDLDLAGTSLDQWAAFIAQQARALPAPVILVGHSRAGIAVSAAAEHDPAAFAALVYLTAFLVPPGQSMAQCARGFSARSRVRCRPFGGSARRGAGDLARSGGRDLLWRLHAGRPDLGGGAARAGADRTDRDALVLSEARYGSVPRHYIECTADVADPNCAATGDAAALPCVSVATLESAHSPFLSMPDQLAAVLDTIAKKDCSMSRKMSFGAAQARSARWPMS